MPRQEGVKDQVVSTDRDTLATAAPTCRCGDRLIPVVSNGYLAGRKLTWIWMATPGGGAIPRISLVL